MKSIEENTYLKLYDSILNLNTLTLTDKVILCEIINLCTINGCFASRGHFQKKLNIKSKTTISNSWSKLQKLSYITINRKYDKRGDGNKIFTIIELTSKTKKLLPNDLNFVRIQDIYIDGGYGLVVE